MTLLDFVDDDMRFHVRVAAVCICDGHVLLQGWDDEGRWILPGGRGEMLETTPESIRREMSEEFLIDVEVGRLLWVSERFWTAGGIRTHQVGFIYEVHLPEGCDLRDVTREFAGDDGGTPFIARWFALESLSDVRVQPLFLREALQSLPETPQHVVDSDWDR